MSDDANLTPEQEADVRRLLAETRHDDPLPADVAGRLDRVLAQLAAGDPDLDPAQVVELASRRRHRAATLLVAAAAIVAVGVGIGQVIPTNGSDSGSAADSAVSGTAAKDFAATESGADQLLLARRAPRARSGATEVRSSHFTTDVLLAGRQSRVRLSSLTDGFAYASEAPVPESAEAEMDEGTADTSDDLNSGSDGVPGATSARSTYECAPGPYGPGRLVAVLYDGEPAVLAFRRPMGDSRIVDLMQCDTADILRSVTLPQG